MAADKAMLYRNQINIDSVEYLPNDPKTHNTNDLANAPKQSMHAFTRRYNAF